jgi:hypothetical protein
VLEFAPLARTTRSMYMKLFYRSPNVKMPIAEFVNTTVTDRDYCVYVDKSLDSILNMKDVSMSHLTEPNAIFSCIMISTSLVSLCVGAKVFKLVAALLSAACSSYITYKLGGGASSVSCDVRILISVLIGIVAGFAATCIINVALFIIGAITLVSFVHIVFTAFPVLHSPLMYWLCVCLSAALGGIMFRWNKKLALEITTSILGGIGLAYGVYGLFNLTVIRLHAFVYFGIFVGSSIAGVCVQRKLRNYKCCDSKPENNEQTK